MSAPALPPDLALLFPDGPGERTLSVPLPPGRVVSPEDGGDPVYWLSDAPPPPGLWARLRAEHHRSGLWPLLLGCLNAENLTRPWEDGEVYPEDMSDPDRFDAAELLAGWWRYCADPYFSDVVAPYTTTWPGLAPAPPATLSAVESAERLAESLLAEPPFDAPPLLGLVAAPCGADALTAVGWWGAANWENDTAKFSAVLRSWQTRFGATVVGVGFATVHVSITTPPSTVDQALPIAAEHFAFCIDNISQGLGTIRRYAEHLVGKTSWHFWWD